MLGRAPPVGAPLLPLVERGAVEGMLLGVDAHKLIEEAALGGRRQDAAALGARADRPIGLVLPPAAGRLHLVDAVLRVEGLEGGGREDRARAAVDEEVVRVDVAVALQLGVARLAQVGRDPLRRRDEARVDLLGRVEGVEVAQQVVVEDEGVVVHQQHPPVHAMHVPYT